MTIMLIILLTFFFLDEEPADETRSSEVHLADLLTSKDVTSDSMVCNFPPPLSLL